MMNRKQRPSHCNKEGDFCWRTLAIRATSEDDPIRFKCLFLVLPNKRQIYLPIEPCPNSFNNGLWWQWSGNEEKPTLSPSVHVKTRRDGSGSWHGNITEGECKN